ncbi:MAG TPA: CaiB/BaiF CoA-transferase family protein [Candidatus Acidoferrales bacterium]|nr:CaiB/BaiF CoA-transferase family protein [Candidatus Acidoferrales bacterium]
MSPSLLAGVRVLSVGHTLPAMYCIPALLDLGADVTLVEAPEAQEVAARYSRFAGQLPTDSLLAGTSRCKIDLRDAIGRDAYLRMAQHVDVVLEGFRPGASARLGIDYERVKSTSPRVIYAAISGYGQAGPWRDRVGHDLNYLAASGVLHLTGDPQDVPAVPGVPFADGIAGMSAALNIVGALWRRMQTGDGCFLDIAIADGPAFLMSMEYDYFRQTGHHRRRGDTHLSGGYPWYHVFETADGRYISIAAVEPHFYARLCKTLGRSDLESQQFAAGSERRALFDAFADIFRSKSLTEWCELLDGEAVCFAPVLTPGEAMQALQPSRRSPMRLKAGATATPKDSAAVLASFGFSEDEIEVLRKRGSVV